MSGVTGRMVLAVASVRDIPRLCACEWEPQFALGRVAGWRLAVAECGCRFHGASAARLAMEALTRGGRRP